MADDADRAVLARHLLGDRLTGDEADRLAAAILPVSSQELPAGDVPPFEVLEEGRLPGGAPYRIKAVQMADGEVLFGIDGPGGTSCTWWLKRPVLERLLAIATQD